MTKVTEGGQSLIYINTKEEIATVENISKNWLKIEHQKYIVVKIKSEIFIG
jgi:predicted nucleic-acid-binding Zn-ribbon protein